MSPCFALQRFPALRGRLGVVVVLLSLGLGACDEGGGGTAQGDAAAAPPAVTVARPLVHEIIEWDEFTGRFEAVEQVALRARVSGHLASVHFTDGQMVEAGDLLFVIDRRPFELAVERAQAQVSEAESRLRLAKLELERAAQLLQRSNLSQATYDQRNEERSTATAALAAAQTALSQAELDLLYTEVRAPVAGRISDRRVDVGNLVSGGTDATLLTTIVSIDPIYFTFDVSETDLLAYKRAMRAGDLGPKDAEHLPVAVRLLDEEGWPHKGSIDFVDNAVDTSSGTLRVRAVIDNADGLITPGIFGRLRLPGSPLYAALLIPDRAVVTDQSRKLVMTVTEDGTVVPKIIRPGPIEAGLRVVRTGLTGDERIVIRGLMRARPGGKVTPEPGEITLPQAEDVESAG